MLTPAYGSGSLAEVLPALLAATGARGFDDRLGVGEARSAVLLLVDGLGARLLAQHPAAAPVMTALWGEEQRTVTTAFPSTTAVSIATLGTALPPARHGIVGYQMRQAGGVLNLLRWTVDGADARETIVPEDAQPHPTVFERASAAGVVTTLVGPRYQIGSGLTRATLRGATPVASAALGDLVVATARAAQAGSLVYAYHADLDLLGHVHGPSSAEWLAQLRFVDALVGQLVEQLPPETLLAVTGDHGMVEVDLDARVDVDAEPPLRDGIELIAGEPRARHLYVRDGALADVLDAWRARLRERALVVTRDEAVAAGWFGAGPAEPVRRRIGDVVVAAVDPGLAIVRTKGESLMAALLGHHGSLTDDEALVPLLLRRP